MIGGAIKKALKNLPPSLNFLIMIIGFLLILFPLLFYNDKIFHPSFFTLLPIIGVSLIIS